MTKDKQRKEAVRALARMHGISYTAALRLMQESEEDQYRKDEDQE